MNWYIPTLKSLKKGQVFTNMKITYVDPGSDQCYNKIENGKD